MSWAKSHETTSYHSDYAGRCDHVVALAYGWSASGSTSARSHLTQTTIAEVKSKWGETYSGWAQPWFQINH